MTIDRRFLRNHLVVILQKMEMEWMCPNCEELEFSSVHAFGNHVIKHKCLYDSHYCFPYERQPLNEEDSDVVFEAEIDEEYCVYLVYDGQTFFPQFRLWSDGTICQCDLEPFCPPPTPIYEDLEIEMADGTVVMLDKATCECFQIPK